MASKVGTAIGTMVGKGISSAVNKAISSNKSSSSSSSGSSSSSANKSTSASNNNLVNAAAGIAGTVAGAAKDAMSAVKSASSNSSSGSGSGSATSAWGGTPSYSYTDRDGNQRTSDSNTDYASLYQRAMDTGDLSGAQAILEQRAQKLGDNKDSWQIEQEDLMNKYKSAQQQQWSQPAEEYKDMYDSYLDDYSAKEDALRAAQQAKVDANVADLNAQKPKVQQAGAQANKAAQQSYYGLIDPNGAGAEQRAALGLANSGLTESAQIAAGNAYMGAVNDNAQNVNDQLAAIDLAITQAQLSGDLATAQQLQSYYDSVLNAGLTAAGNIAKLNQWGLENAQNQTQQGIANGFTQAGLTGIYNGQQTMQGQQNAASLIQQELQNQITAENLRILLALGYKQEEANYLAKTYANEGQRLANIYQGLANSWASANGFS